MTNYKSSGRHKDTVPAVLDNGQFPDETAHLAMVNEKLEAAVQAANDDVKRIDKEYMAAKRYMADYRGEIDPHEMFQNEMALRQIDQTGAFAVGTWEKLAKLRESPYFARIDFQQQHESLPTKYYIGRFTFNYENKPLIFDWRAPVAGMFYDCEVGPAGYDAPMGRIDGELTRKRQFKVRGGVLEYVLESSVNIQDDVLQRELSQTSDEKMKSIIATIQKEQNQIIRNENVQTMLIQGVAGSGKTSIALHRIAFLLYRFKDRLTARNITILSPNKVFSDYISTVLPELGEEPIYGLSFYELAEIQLEGVIGFEREPDPLENQDTKWAERVRFKSTLDFVKQMDRYLEQLPELIFEAEDYRFGSFEVTADWITDRFHAYQSQCIKKRLKLIADDIHDRFTTSNYMEEELPKVRAILGSLNKMLKIKSSLALYKHFYQWLERPDLLRLPKRQTLEWADVFPFLYLHSAFEGLKESRLIKHLVIDEMQDYTPVQYAVINLLFPCQKTILGDFGQFVHPNHLHTLEDLHHLYRDGLLIELTKSYRSTYEIITFAKGIQPVNKLEPMERHGEQPILIACRDRTEQIQSIKNCIDAFLSSANHSLGIIVKTNREAQALYGLLVTDTADTANTVDTADYQVNLISPDSKRYETGISITSIQMAKGLEFDEVLIADASDEIYHTEYDRSLLYIAVTRAMHKLTIVYTGRPSRLLPV